MMRVCVYLVCLCLSGCLGIGGFWMNGNPAIGRNITPLSDKWEKTGISHEERRSDWVDCGGDTSGDYGMTEEDNQKGKTSNESSRIKFDSMQYCMMRKGYTYTATCEGEIAARSPACIARKNAETE